jgi:hypothetical protein
MSNIQKVFSFPKLGIVIDGKTDKAKVAELVAKYPEVRRAFARIESAKNTPNVKAASESK